MQLAIRLGERLELPTDEFGDERWDRESVEKFLPPLRQFATESDFDRFFAENGDFYAVAVERFQPVYEALNQDWYHRFYGQAPNETFHILLAPGNGYANYGPGAEGLDGTRNVYSILGAFPDAEGMPIYPMGRVLPLVVHEFNHSFINHLIQSNLSKLQAAGERLFSIVEEAMRQQAYTGWEEMMAEALVRAAEVKYRKDHGATTSEIDRAIEEHTARGFFWIEALVAELDNYDRGREVYPTLESYMLRIIELYNKIMD